MIPETGCDVYGTEAVQKYLLPIIKDIDCLCRENEIEYSLMGGALLGTVRHHGFIPWDDDIDIIFDRGNFEKFLSVCEEKLPEQYKIIRSIWVKRITRKDNPRILQEEGCIDLFVFDNVPDNAFFAKIKILFLKLLQGMLKKDIAYQRFGAGKKFLLWFTHIIGKIFSDETEYRWYDKVSQWGNKNKTNSINNYVTYFDMLGMKYENDVASKYTDADFEGLKVRIFEKYDSVLTTQFGDWHQLPPEEMRKPKHLKSTV